MLPLIIVTLLVAVLLRVHFFFYLVYVFFGIHLFSRFWSGYVLKVVQCQRRYTDRALPGDHVTVEVVLRNQGWLPVVWLRVYDSLPVQLKATSFRYVASLLPKETVTLSYELECRRRGYYQLGPLVLSSGDLFGLRTQERRIEQPDHLLVYPRIVPLTSLALPAQTPFGAIASKQHLYEDPSRMIGVREYRSGDSLRDIHWKTTAATGALQVKRFQPAISIEAHILVNLNRHEYTLARAEPASELAIVVAASIAHHLVEKRQTVGLSCNGMDPLATEGQAIHLPPRKGREQLAEVLDVLARVKLGEQVPFADVLQQANLYLHWGGTAVVVTADADDALFDTLVRMKRSGFHVLLVLVDPRSPHAALRQRAQQVGIQAHQVWQESDLDVWR
jgi:uncharacterized protein (DUF58 family)